MLDFKLLKHLLLPSFLIWLIPFVVSFLFYNKSGKMVGDFWTFKITMIVVVTIASFFALKKFYQNNKIDFFEVSLVVIAVQIVLDILVLIFGLKMDLGYWAWSVLPIYFVIIPLTNYFLSKKFGKQIKIAK